VEDPVVFGVPRGLEFKIYLEGQPAWGGKFAEISAEI
jgi:hypothetical protein